MAASVLEFKINGASYRANPMDARQQFHVVRRLTGLASLLTGLSGLAGIPKDEQVAAIMAALPALLSRLGEVMDTMSNDSVDYVINACLAVTERQDAATGAWAPVVASNGMIMFDDVRNSMAALVQIVVPIIRRDIMGFFSELPKEALGGLLGLKA